MGKLRVACIGLGGFARNYRQAVTKLSAQDRVQVVAVSDVNMDLCEEAAEELAKDKPRIFSDYTAMLQAFVLATQAFVILHRPENLGTEQTIALRFKGAIVNGLWFFNFTK